MRQGGFVQVHGEVHQHRDTLQIKIFQIESLADEALDLTDFLPVTPYDRDELMKEWRARVAEISLTPLKALLADMLDDENLGWRFANAPAGKTWHWACVSPKSSSSCTTAVYGPKARAPNKMCSASPCRRQVSDTHRKSRRRC